VRQGNRLPAQARQKLSTTIAPESYEYLQRQVETGQANTLADAIDNLVATVRRLENRIRLERETAAYFQSLSPQALAEERKLESVLSESSVKVNFDD
jgi:hypothetical protein